jgi:predicted transcriptional regulator
MSRQTTATLTPREAAIMQILWDGGPAPAETIRATLADGTHDSSVRTILRILEQKGYVRHETVGKAYVYSPCVRQDNAQTTAMRDLLSRFFGGSARSLVVRLMEDRELTAEQLAEIAALARSAREKTNRPAAARSSRRSAGKKKRSSP